MTKQIYHEFFYYHSIPEMLFWGVGLTAVWAVLALFATRKKWTREWIWMNRVLLVVVVLFIFYWTVGRRSGSGTRELSLIPFHSFVVALPSSERYRSFIANILLFVPIGLCGPFSLCRSTGSRAPKNGSSRKYKTRALYPVITTILSAGLLSAAIELIQYLFALGLCETDDILANLTGAALGVLAFVLYARFRNCDRITGERKTGRE